MVYLKESNIQVESAAEVSKVFQNLFSLEDLIEQDKENFYVMHLNVRNQVKMVDLVNVGVLTYSPVHPRDTFCRAVIAGSAAIIIAHNHPSGEPDPSDEDTKLTKLIFEAGKLLGIAMLDHIIFTKDNYWSFKKIGGGGEKAMSVIMVQDETINRVVEWLFCEVERSPYLESQLGQKLSEAVGIDITHDQWCAELGQAMFELNIAGVNAR